MASKNKCTACGIDFVSPDNQKNEFPRALCCRCKIDAELFLQETKKYIEPLRQTTPEKYWGTAGGDIPAEVGESLRQLARQVLQKMEKDKCPGQ